MRRNKLSRPETLLVCICFLFTATVSADISGEKLYMKNCMVCHADDGSGVMPGVQDLEKNRSWSRIDESELLKRLKEGIKSSESGVSMPAKGGNTNLTDNDLKKIIRYMRGSFLK